MSLSFPSFLETILTSVAGESVLRPCLLRPPRRRRPRWWSWSFFGLKEVCWVEEDCFLLDVSTKGELVDLFFPLESFPSFLLGLFPLGHLESMSRVLAEDWSIAFASTLTAFSMTSSQEFRSWLWTSIWARTEGFRPSRKYRIMIRSFGPAPGSNFWRPACSCSRWAAQLRTSSCRYWESLLSFP